MKDLRALALNRVSGWHGDETCGAFLINSRTDGKHLQVIASSGMGWDHVSVSRADRVPNWCEMQQIARLFFEDAEIVMQLHVPASDHINVHPNCLHLWRPQAAPIPLPPKEMIA